MAPARKIDLNDIAVTVTTLAILKLVDKLVKISKRKERERGF